MNLAEVFNGAILFDKPKYNFLFNIHSSNQFDSYLDERLGVFQMTGNVFNKTCLGSVIQHFGPVRSHLSEIVIVGRVVASHIARNCEFRFEGSRNVVGARKTVREIVGETGVVGVERHRPVSLIIQSLGAVRTIDWKVEVVGSKSVAVSVRVGKETSLYFQKVKSTDSDVSVNQVNIERITWSILSGLGSIPGTKCAGLKAICSTSAK